MLRENDISLKNNLVSDYTYGWPKLTGEYLAQIYEKYGLKSVCYRPFSEIVEKTVI